MDRVKWDSPSLLDKWRFSPGFTHLLSRVHQMQTVGKEQEEKSREAKEPISENALFSDPISSQRVIHGPHSYAGRTKPFFFSSFSRSLVTRSFLSIGFPLFTGLPETYVLPEVDLIGGGINCSIHVMMDQKSGCDILVVRRKRANCDVVGSINFGYYSYMAADKFNVWAIGKSN